MCAILSFYSSPCSAGVWCGMGVVASRHSCVFPLPHLYTCTCMVASLPQASAQLLSGACSRAWEQGYLYGMVPVTIQLQILACKAWVGGWFPMAAPNKAGHICLKGLHSQYLPVLPVADKIWARKAWVGGCLWLPQTKNVR